MAIAAAAACIVDLDIVNPYFRASDVTQMLRSRGIEVISPRFANTNLDLPSLPPEIYSVFLKEGPVIFDVGGDDDGAVALGRFKRQFDDVGYEMYMVVNTLRPLTSSADEIIAMLRGIEYSSRLKVTGLINNTNLMGDTVVSHIIEGQKILENVSRETFLPIKYICGMGNVLEDLPQSLADMTLSLDKHTGFEY